MTDISVPPVRMSSEIGLMDSALVFANRAARGLAPAVLTILVIFLAWWALIHLVLVRFKIFRELLGRETDKDKNGKRRKGTRNTPKDD